MDHFFVCLAMISKIEYLNPKKKTRTIFFFFAGFQQCNKTHKILDKSQTNFFSKIKKKYQGLS